jgi:hypothetical protein
MNFTYLGCFSFYVDTDYVFICVYTNKTYVFGYTCVYVYINIKTQILWDLDYRYNKSA